MPNCLTKRWGGLVTDPTPEDLRAALQELDSTDQEHPDCWVSNGDDWSLSFNDSGLAILENAETGEGPWHLKGVDREAAFAMWQLLISSGFDALKSRYEWSGAGRSCWSLGASKDVEKERKMSEAIASRDRKDLKVY